MTALCDLHVHSTRSDGTVPPAELVRRARDAGLAAMALTDHDTFDGVPEALAAGEALGVRVVPGVELSLPHAGTFHMIGLSVDPANARLRAVADVLREGRGPRNREIVEKLRALGVDITIEEVDAEAGGDVVARPHIARVLMKKGVVGSFQDAFDRFLKKGGPAYAERPRVDLPEAIAAIRDAGGASVLCHPATLGIDDDALLLAELRRMAEAGLDAVGRPAMGGARRRRRPAPVGRLGLPWRQQAGSQDRLRPRTPARPARVAPRDGGTRPRQERVRVGACPAPAPAAVNRPAGRAPTSSRAASARASAASAARGSPRGR
jgi:predicted metal-dependent phosphoesterase TrpH